MPKKRPQPERPATQLGTAAPKSTLPHIPAEAALSFLKDTKGALTWSVRELADSLKISRRDAEQVIPLLAAQGYVQRASGSDAWITTPAGESVSGAKPPRFTRERVEQAVVSLKERIKQVNQDSKAAFRIKNAVAFGDFLLADRARVQAAEVGVGLTQLGDTEGGARSASTAKAERQFLRQLRGKTALLHIRPYADWMNKRAHLNLM
jgi:DNA-binding transcriptional MocR family regulator